MNPFRRVLRWAFVPVLAGALAAGESPSLSFAATQIDGEILHANTLEYGFFTFRDVTAKPGLNRQQDALVLTFNELQGKAYHGRVHGSYEMRLPRKPGDPSEHRCHFELEDIDLQALVRSLGAQADGLAGRLSGWVELEIPIGKPETITGRGELHIIDASLVQLPLLVSLLAGDPTGARGKDRLNARFEIRSSEVQVLWARLDSPAAELAIQGSIQFDGKLRLQVLPRLPFRLVDHVPLLGPLLSGGLRGLTTRFGRSLIRGHVSRPVIQLDPFGR